MVMNNTANKLLRLIYGQIYKQRLYGRQYIQKDTMYML